MAPLSPGRYKLQVTLSRETRDKLLRAQELMRHVQPNGDMAVVLDRALTCLVEELECRKFGRRKHAAKATVDGAGAESRPESSPATGRPAAPAAVDELERRSAAPARCASARPTGSAAAVQAVPRAPGRVPPTASSGGSTESRRAGSPGSRSIPRPVRREVAERDGYRCTFVAADGRRCEQRGRLEYHHVLAHALGGGTSAENITLRCQAHNLVEAVNDFGVEAVRGRHR